MISKSKLVKIISFGLAPLFVVVALFLLAPSTDALKYGEGIYGSCTYGECSITVGTSGSVTLNLQPDANGVYTIQSDTVNVKTGASTGYTLSLESDDADTSLVSGANTIPATSGSYASPASLSLNRWGYRLDGVGSFGAGPTAAVTNVATSSLSFAGLPASGSPDTIAATTSASTPVTGDNYSIWYGVRADLTPPAGTYTRTLTYTAAHRP